MNRILLQCGTEVRKFISFYQDEKDGSLYITFVRSGTTNSSTYHYINEQGFFSEHSKTVQAEIPKQFQVHYHTSGRINFKDTENLNIFGEPIISITQYFWFASLIIPDFKLLDPHTEEIKESDFVLPIQENCSQRRQYDLCISPFSNPITSYGFVKGHFSYPPFYTLNVIESDKPIPPIEENDMGFMFLSPQTGLYETQKITQEAAHIKYQQKRTGHNGPIIYGPNNNYEYRVIFPGAATEPPTIDAVFDNNVYKLEVIKVTKSQARFRILDASGSLLRMPIQFTRVELGDYRLTLHVK